MHKINRVPWICGLRTLYSCSGGRVFTAAAAGRVQSVALRLVAEREAEIEAHAPREYWSVAARLRAPDERTFDARLTQASPAPQACYDQALYLLRSCPTSCQRGRAYTWVICTQLYFPHQTMYAHVYSAPFLFASPELQPALQPAPALHL